MVAYARRMFNGGAIQTTVPLGIGSSDGSFTLATGGSTNWPDGSTGNFVIIVDVGTPEKILCSARSGLVVTVAASGRGYDGTSAASHPTGSAIQVIHCAQDDDEANQVVSAVLGQSGAAKGDIPVILSAAGPVTMTRLGVGANGSVLSAASGTPAYSLAGTSGMLLQSAGSAVPTWLVPPGYLLASQYLASSHTYSVAATTLTALDATNATLSFTVPASGNVDVEVQGFASITITASATEVTLALLNHSGGAQIGNSTAIEQLQVANTGTFSAFRKRFHLTGLTPGALQVDVAAAYTAASGSSAQILVANSTGTISGGAGEPLLIQAFAA